MHVDAQDAEVGIYTYGRLSANTKPLVCYIIDVSQIRDPQANRGFKARFDDGRAIEIMKYVAEDKRVDAIVQQIHFIAELNLHSPAADKQWLSFGIRDHHGRWCAPAVGEIAANALSNAGFKVCAFHYDLMAGGEKS